MAPACRATSTETGEFPYRFDAAPGAEHIQRVIWIIENLHGGWDANSRFIYFENDDDAVQYRLTWVGIK
jgi:hypothetical protein